MHLIGVIYFYVTQQWKQRTRSEMGIYTSRCIADFVLEEL